LCREEALALHSLVEEKKLDGTKLIGIIKEVAPVSGAETDEVLGINEFNTQYFPYPLYRDRELKFYAALGSRSFWSLASWNPFTWYKAYQEIKTRLAGRNIKGNLAGEGFLLGGVLLVTPTEGVVYRYQEVTGQSMPLPDIEKALRKVAPPS
jgi:hypothetical protein